MTTPPQIPSLAAQLRDKRSDLRTVECQVDDLIEHLFVGWRSRFPTEAGWRFTDPDVLDVYDVVADPAAVDALWHAGFRVVVLHDHNLEYTSGTRCKCPTRSPS